MLILSHSFSVALSIFYSLQDRVIFLKYFEAIDMTNKSQSENRFLLMKCTFILFRIIVIIQSEISQFSKKKYRKRQSEVTQLCIFATGSESLIAVAKTYKIIQLQVEYEEQCLTRLKACFDNAHLPRTFGYVTKLSVSWGRRDMY